MGGVLGHACRQTSADNLRCLAKVPSGTRSLSQSEMVTRSRESTFKARELKEKEEKEGTIRPLPKIVHIYILSSGGAQIIYYP